MVTWFQDSSSCRRFPKVCPSSSSYMKLSVGIIFFPPLRERCEWRHAVGVVLSICELRPEAGSAQQVLSDAGQPGFPHLCVWSVLSHLVLHHHSGGARTYSTKQGIAIVK